MAIGEYLHDRNYDVIYRSAVERQPLYHFNNIFFSAYRRPTCRVQVHFHGLVAIIERLDTMLMVRSCHTIRYEKFDIYHPHCFPDIAKYIDNIIDECIEDMAACEVRHED